jgi:ferredoxin
MILYLKKCLEQKEYPMANVAIHYFSGTGNTDHAAKVLAEELEKHYESIKLIRVKKGMKPVQGSYNYHIVLFPVYALTIPYSLEVYLKKLQDGRNVKTAVIANHGMINLKGGLNTGYESQSTLKAARILKKRNYNVMIIDAVGYPENITIFASALKKDNEKAIIEAGDEKIRKIAHKIAKGEKSLKKYNLLDTTLGWLFGFVFTYLGRWQFGKLYIADKDCNGCKICEKACPTHAIRMVYKRPRWNYRCDACLCCYNRCPENAIQVSLVRLAAILAISIWPIFYVIEKYQYIFEAVLGWLPFPIFVFLTTNPLFTALFCIAVYCVICLALLFLSDKVFFLLEQAPFIRRLFELTYSKNLRRYLAPGYKPEK